MRYALILDNEIKEIRDYEALPECKHVDGLPVLRPLIDPPTPNFDPATQVLTSVLVIQPDQVERVYTVIARPFDLAVSNLKARVQNHLDAAAQAKDFDNISSAALRAAYPGPFNADGVKYATWMDACWAHCYEVLAAVQAGTRAIPTGDELIAELPALT